MSSRPKEWEFPYPCPRCGNAIENGEDEEACWYCFGPLCIECWRTVAHCGHPEAYEISRVSRLMSADQRMKMVEFMPQPKPCPGAPPFEGEEGDRWKTSN